MGNAGSMSLTNNAGSISLAPSCGSIPAAVQVPIGIATTTAGKPPIAVSQASMSLPVGNQGSMLLSVGATPAVAKVLPSPRTPIRGLAFSAGSLSMPAGTGRTPTPGPSTSAPPGPPVSGQGSSRPTLPLASHVPAMPPDRSLSVDTRAISAQKTQSASPLRGGVINAESLILSRAGDKERHGRRRSGALVGAYAPSPSMPVSVGAKTAREMMPL